MNKNLIIDIASSSILNHATTTTTTTKTFYFSLSLSLSRLVLFYFRGVIFPWKKAKRAFKLEASHHHHHHRNYSWCVVYSSPMDLVTYNNNKSNLQGVEMKRTFLHSSLFLFNLTLYNKLERRKRDNSRCVRPRQERGVMLLLLLLLFLL